MSCNKGEKRRLSACSVIFNSKREVLVGHKIKYNAWEYPGGKIEPNEDIITGARRELYEETGIEPVNYEFVTFFDLKKWLLFVYTGFSDQLPELREPDKHYAWHFVSIPFYLQQLAARPGALTKVNQEIGPKSLFLGLTLLMRRGILDKTDEEE